LIKNQVVFEAAVNWHSTALSIATRRQLDVADIDKSIVFYPGIIDLMVAING